MARYVTLSFMDTNDLEDTDHMVFELTGFLELGGDNFEIVAHIGDEEPDQVRIRFTVEPKEKGS